MPFHLTFRTAVLNARRAYDEGRLAAQNGDTSCTYHSGDGTVCALGASLPGTVVDGLYNGISLAGLIDSGRIEVSPDDAGALHFLQMVHDNWACEWQVAVAPRRFARGDPLPEWIFDWLAEHELHFFSEEVFVSFLAAAERELKITPALPEPVA